VMLHDNVLPYTAAATQELIATFGREQFGHPSKAQVIFMCSSIRKLSLVADGSTTTTR
jgi:hypothetical protein